MSAKLPIHVVADLWSKETGQPATELERLLLPWVAERTVKRAAPRLEPEDESEGSQPAWRPPIIHRGTLMDQSDLATFCAERGLTPPKFWFARGWSDAAAQASLEQGEPSAPPPPPPPRGQPHPQAHHHPHPAPPRAEEGHPAQSAWRLEEGGRAAGAWVRRAGEGDAERHQGPMAAQPRAAGRLGRTVGWAAAASLVLALGVLLLPPDDLAPEHQIALEEALAPETAPAAGPGSGAQTGSNTTLELPPGGGTAGSAPAGAGEAPPLPPTLVTDALPVRDPGAAAVAEPTPGAALRAESGGGALVTAHSGEPEAVVPAAETGARQSTAPSGAPQEVVAALPPERSGQEVAVATVPTSPPAEVVAAREAAEVEPARVEAALPPTGARQSATEQEELASRESIELLRDRRSVQRLQELLRASGYDPGSPDGLYGARTSNAIRAYQTARGLKGDGLPTPEVLAALEQEVAREQRQTQPLPQPQPSAPAAAPGDARQTVIAALEAQRTGALERAIELYSVAIDADSLPIRDLAHALNNRAVARAGLGDLNGAIDDCSRAIAMIGNYPAAFLNRGIALRRLGQTDAAIQDFNAALRIQPRYAKAYLARAQAREDRNDLEGAIRDYSRALEIEPSSALAHFQRGRAYRLAGQAALARADFEKAANLEPNNRIYEAALRDLGSNS